MPIHGNYRHLLITIRVVETEGRIEYSSQAAGYHGFLDYELTDTTLDIHTLVAQPEGERLGAFLMWICANTAIWKRKTAIRSLSTAQTAMPFYIAMGFAPDPTLLAEALAITAGVENAPAPHNYVATWIAQTGACLDRAYASSSPTWTSVAAA